MDEPLSRDLLADRLAEIYRAIGPLYRKVARVVDREQSVMGMSVGVRAVLEQLDREGKLTIPAIASAQELSRQFVQRMVHDAREAGFVELVDNPRHRRSSLVRITGRGQAAISGVTAREHRMMGDVPGGITQQEADATLRVLRHMLTGLESVEHSQK